MLFKSDIGQLIRVLHTKQSYRLSFNYGQTQESCTRLLCARLLCAPTSHSIEITDR